MKRNINLLIAVLAGLLIMLPSCGQKPNTLTSSEKRDGWILLFNGKDFTGWRQCNGTAMPVNWTIEDDAMKVFTGIKRRHCLW